LPRGCGDRRCTVSPDAARRILAVPDPAAVEGVSELVLEVADLARAETFYTEVLGLPVVERWPHRDAVWVLAGPTRIGLWKPQVGLEGSRGGEHVHFAMRIPEESFDDRVNTMRAHGHPVPVHEFGPLADGAPPTRAAYVHDPDGHLVEFWTADMRAYGEAESPPLS
jgi:catechol 2,3-dioxygenase-like lactoylglutathione lyase family enzyme